MNNYTDKNIWIIGASSGIGRALAVELSRRGATLALSARSEGKLQSLNEELGGGHIVLPFDVSNTYSYEQAAQELERKFTRIDSTLFLAALYSPNSLEAMDIDEAKAMVDVNLNGALNTIHCVLPILKKQKGGQLALCGSVAGYRGLPNGQPYSATKAAVINLAESLKAEHSEFDIKVINPGFVRTPLTDKNDFKMPMMIEPEQAAEIIAKELLTSRFEIHFPKGFTFFLKFIALLPSRLYFKIAPKTQL